MMRMKKSDFMRYWHIYGILLTCIGGLLAFIEYNNSGGLSLWLTWILLILFVALSIGWSIDTFLEFVEEVENGVAPVWHWNYSYQSALTLGSYCLVFVILFIGFKIHPEKLALIVLPLIPVCCGITLGTYAAARIYLIHKGYDINRFVTTLETICSIILILPVIIPIIYIINNGI